MTARDRGGWTLAEVLVVLVLTALLAAAAASAVESHRKVVHEMVARAQVDESVRVIRGVLGDDLRGGGPVSVGSAGDSVALRVYRSRAVPCSPLPGTGWRVDSRGIRRGDPEKDSVQLLGVDGTWRTAALVSVGGRPGPCGDPAATERWEVDPPQEVPPVLLRSFERGSYHLSVGALRYRRGAGGRQPLTPEFLDDRESGLYGVGERVVVTLQPRDRGEEWVRNLVIHTSPARP